MVDFERNTVVSYLAGTLFSVGWWCTMDAFAVTTYWQLDPANGGMNGAYLIPAIAGTISMIILNLVPASAFDTSDFFGGDSSRRIKLLIFFAFLFAFGGLFGSAWIFFDFYVARQVVVPANVSAANPDGAQGKTLMLWIGLSVFLQNLFIFLR